MMSNADVNNPDAATALSPLASDGNPLAKARQHLTRALTLIGQAQHDDGDNVSVDRGTAIFARYGAATVSIATALDHIADTDGGHAYRTDPFSASR